MLRALATSESGLQQASRRLAAAAHNTANLSTADTAVVRVHGREVPAAGVDSRTEARLEGRAELGSAAATDRRSLSPAVDATVESRVARHQAAALGAVVRTADDMLGRLLDAVA